jgi:hypothetical protein
LNQLALTYMSARMTHAIENNFSSMKNERVVKKVLLDVFEELSGLGEHQSLSILRRFDQVLESIVDRHAGDEPSMGVN